MGSKAEEHGGYQSLYKGGKQVRVTMRPIETAAKAVSEEVAIRRKRNTPGITEAGGDRFRGLRLCMRRECQTHGNHATQPARTTHAHIVCLPSAGISNLAVLAEAVIHPALCARADILWPIGGCAARQGA